MIYTENMNDNENQGIDRSYADWDLIPFHKSLNSSVKLPTQETLRVTGFLMGNSEELELSDAMHLYRCKSASEI